MLNKGEKTPFLKVVILEKLLLCEMSSSTANNKMRSHQTLRNINHFIGGRNLFQTKRTYLLNIGEKNTISQNSNCIEITTLRKR